MGLLDGTQYAEGRYAVHKHPVILYADIKFYFNESFACRSLIRLKDEPSIGIIYRRWPTKTPIMVLLNLIGLKLLSGQGFYAPINRL